MELIYTVLHMPFGDVTFYAIVAWLGFTVVARTMAELRKFSLALISITVAAVPAIVLLVYCVYHLWQALT